jgi:hypothetical protein
MLVLWLLLPMTGSPAYAADPPDPLTLLARAKEVSGGAAWDAKRSLHQRLSVDAGGLHGTAEAWQDLLTGRSLSRYRLGPVSGADGFDGKVAWSQDASGQVKRSEDADGRQQAANDAFLAVMGYWYPSRRKAVIEYLAERREGSRAFHVLRMTPEGGRPLELWIDRASSLFDRIVDRGATETRTTFFSDYRLRDGVRQPFRTRTSNGETKYDQVAEIQQIDFNAALDPTMFRVPDPPSADFSIAGGAAATTVPFDLVNNHIYVKVWINDRGPFSLLCDTGGANVMTPELARTLGLRPEGRFQGQGVGEKSEDVSAVKVAKLRIGEASLADQVFMVFPIRSFERVEGVPELGLIGYEVFKRFVVRIDYQRRELTLHLPERYRPSGKGAVVPFRFAGTIPQVDGEIDGIKGSFDIDTGSRVSLDLLGPFVEENHLVDKYRPQVEGVTGWGVGGPARSRVTRAHLLRLGGVEIREPITELSLQKKGAFSNRYVAGNVGAGVLKRFTLTLDYGRQQITFERNANFDARDTFDRAGMWLNGAAEGFEVVDVFRGSPAAQAGLSTGDRILEIDGRKASAIALPDLRDRFRRDAPGTKVSLLVRTRKAQRHVDLVLRELVP